MIVWKVCCAPCQNDELLVNLGTAKAQTTYGGSLKQFTVFFRVNANKWHILLPLKMLNL